MAPRRNALPLGSVFAGEGEPGMSIGVAVTRAERAYDQATAGGARERAEWCPSRVTRTGPSELGAIRSAAATNAGVADAGVPVVESTRQSAQSSGWTRAQCAPPCSSMCDVGRAEMLVASSCASATDAAPGSTSCRTANRRQNARRAGRRGVIEWRKLIRQAVGGRRWAVELQPVETTVGAIMTIPITRGSLTP